MRPGYIVTYVALALSVVAAHAQENASLGDLARQARAQRESASGKPKATPSQCTQGPVSLAQIFAWQMAGMSSADIARAISSRGINSEPNSELANKLLQNAFSPDIEAAIASAQQSISQRIVPVTVLQHLSRAAELTNQNDYRDALLAIQDVTKEDPTNADFFTAAGALFVRIRDLDNAKRSYVRAAQLIDNCAYIHAQLSSIYYALEDAGNAQSEARKVFALDQGSAEARQLLAHADALHIAAEHEYLPSGEDVDQSEYENNAHQRVSNEALHYSRAGLAKQDHGDFAGAVRDYQQAIAIEPKWWAPRYNLGLAYTKLGRFQEAVVSYKEAKVLSPEHLAIRQNLGYCLCKLNRWYEAIAEFQQILKIDPTWNMARPCLYNALRAVQRYNEAEQVYQDEQKYKALGFDDE